MIALALILFEGGLAAGFDEVSPVLAPGVLAGNRRHARHRRRHRARREVDRRAVHAAGTAARLDRGRDRQRRDLLRPARFDDASGGSRRPRGRVRSERPGRGAARDRVHRLDHAAGLRDRRHGRAVRRAARRSAAAIGLVVGQLAVARAARAAPLVEPGSTRSPRSPPPRSPTASRRPRTARASSRSTWPGLAVGGARIPARRTIDEFHAGIAWVSQIVLFITLGLLVVPPPARERRGRGARDRRRADRRSPARSPRSSRPASAASRCARRC